MKHVPFLDLKAAYLEVKDEIDLAVARVMESGWYILGQEVAIFEEQFAKYCEVEHCIGVGNGLDALKLVLVALEIGAGDELIVPSNTFIATWLAVSEVGGTPVPVEPNPDTHNIDVENLEKSITSKTRAIIPVHLYGQPADLDPILQLADRYSIPVIEDAAQAHGSRYKGRRIGGHTKAATWSFYPGKNLGALGDAGAITTNDGELAEKLRLLRNYGSVQKYHHEVAGVNSRLDPLQAAILSVKLKHLDEWNERRSKVAATYIDALRNTRLILPKVPDWADPVWHLFVVRSSKRDELKQMFDDAGVGTLIHYPVPPHLQQVYTGLGYRPKAFPLAEKMAEEVLSLPIGPHLALEDVDRVIDVVLTELERTR